MESGTILRFWNAGAGRSEYRLHCSVSMKGGNPNDQIVSEVAGGGTRAEGCIDEITDVTQQASDILLLFGKACSVVHQKRGSCCVQMLQCS
jgi:hypothetical protein